jgi:hypothetical protein
MSAEQELRNEAAEGVPFYTPVQDPPAGTAVTPQPNGKPLPKLFAPLQIRGMTMQNRIMVSPMCQYSAHEGFHTPWHSTHLGGIVQRGVCIPDSFMSPLNAIYNIPIFTEKPRLTLPTSRA